MDRATRPPAPALVAIARALAWAPIAMVCWALLPLGIAVVMIFVTPTYWRPMLSSEGLGLIAAALAAIGMSLGAAAIARKVARPSRPAVLAALGIVLVAFLFQFVALWLVLLGPALVALMHP